MYPNLMAHVWEAIGAILERPWGCGEQTISSTYPSILLLQYARELRGLVGFEFRVSLAAQDGRRHAE